MIHEARVLQRRGGEKNEETVLERDPPLAEHIWSIAGNGKTDHVTQCVTREGKKKNRCIGLEEPSLLRKSGKRNVAGTENVKQRGGKVGLSVQLPITNSCSPPSQEAWLNTIVQRPPEMSTSVKAHAYNGDHNKFCHTHKLYMHIATRHAHTHTCS